MAEFGRWGHRHGAIGASYKFRWNVPGTETTVFSMGLRQSHLLLVGGYSGRKGNNTSLFCFMQVIRTFLWQSLYIFGPMTM